MPLKICVLGLGYVGLPIAIKLSEKFDVIGYDIDKSRIRELKKHTDSTNEVSSAQLKRRNLNFTFNSKDIQSTKRDSSSNK